MRCASAYVLSHGNNCDRVSVEAQGGGLELAFLLACLTARIPAVHGQDAGMCVWYAAHVNAGTLDVWCA